MIDKNKGSVRSRFDGVLDADAGQAAAIGQAGGVGEHVAERDRAAGRLGDHRLVLAGDIDAVVLPGGDVAADRVVELEVALFIEHHQRDRGDRLGHRIDAEDGVVGHRLAALQVHRPEGLAVGDLSAPGDGDLGAHDLLRADVVALEVVGDALQARGVEAGPLRLGVHKNPPEENGGRSNWRAS